MWEQSTGACLKIPQQILLKGLRKTSNTFIRMASTSLIT